MNFKEASWKAKDLLEASGQSQKASLEFKALFEKMATDNISYDHAVDEVKKLAQFVYGDDKRVNYFISVIGETLQ